MKKDIKYIIKRIIVGVGIAIILGLLHTKGVLAETIPDSICANVSSNGSSVINFGNCVSDTTYLNNSTNINNDFNYYSSYYNNNFYLYNLSFYNEDLDLYTIVEQYTNDDVLFQEPYNYIGLYDSCNDSNISYCNNNSRYRLFYSKSELDLNNNSTFPSQPGSIDFFRFGLKKYIFITDNSTTADYINNNLYESPYNVSQTITVGSKLYYLFSTYYSGGIMNKDFIFSDNTVVYNSYTNYTNSNDIFYIWNKNNVKQQINSIPSYYQEIDITDYQAVYFIPKDYTLVPSFIKDNKEYLHFDYYLSGSVNSAYFNIENTNDDINFNSDENLVSFSGFEYIESSFPLYYKNDDLSAYILFNTGTETKIKYDSRYYNYYLVSDLSDYINQVQFIDENGESLSKYISFTAILEDYWLKGFSSGGDNFINDSCSDGGICSDHITGYIDFLKMPFSFLKKISKDKCTPISIPIPFVNGNISINCLSSLFKNILGDFYDILLYIITGLYAYRITILNIDTITDVLNPSDDKLEVIDL